jgi:hypothetical protein
LNLETIGLISGILVVISGIPYSIRTYQGKIQPNLTSWSLWTLIGLSILLTYKSSGAGANVWPAIFGFTNPFIVTILILKRRCEWIKPDKFEILCLVFGLLSLGLWFLFRDSRELSQYTLYLAIIADSCAAVPTMIFVWLRPDGDRPFAWLLFSIGYGLAIFAISEHTFANYILPVYMFLGAWIIALPLALYRWKQKIPLSEWI